MQLYRKESSNPKWDAQRNLQGRTHYVDDDTLRFHKSRVISARTVDNGLLYAIVTSDSIDFENTKRGFRYVIFDLFGTVISRTDIEKTFRTSAQATKAMWADINTIPVLHITHTAIERAKEQHTEEMNRLFIRVQEATRVNP